MDFVYYIVRKKDNVILDGSEDMVGAIKIGQQQNCACLIMQACIITEVGSDEPIDEEVIQPDIIENDENEVEE